MFNFRCPFNHQFHYFQKKKKKYLLKIFFKASLYNHRTTSIMVVVMVVNFYVSFFSIIFFVSSSVMCHFHHHDHHTAFKFLRLISIQNKNNDFFSIVYSQIQKDKGKIVFVSHYVIQNTRSHAFFIIIIIRFRKTIETVELKTRASC